MSNNTRHANTKLAALNMRLAGATYQDITNTLALNNIDSAKQLVEEALADETITSNDEKKTYRNEEEQRILKLLHTLWGKANNPNHPEHLTAARTALALIDRHAKLLGLDAPTEVVVHNPTQTEIDTWVMTVLQQTTEATLGQQEADITQLTDDTLAVTANNEREGT